MNQLDSLFPDTVETVYSDRPPERFEFFPPENAAAASMRANRRREFAHGRACARQALSALGISPCPIPVGECREPLWPEGIVGSISHCGPHAAAVVAHETALSGLGVDIEKNDRIEDTLVRLICRREELHDVDSAESGLIREKLIFSSKESIFKCVWPILRHFIEFQDIAIRLNTAESRFTAISRHRKLSRDLIGSIEGRYRHSGAMIITAAYIC